MTRIISGSARGASLKIPPGGRTRPTTDRVREAFFSALATWSGGTSAAVHEQLAGISFLDLYAGSGAIGLEAASRGAQHVLFVDNLRPAAHTIRKNAESAGLADKISVQIADVSSVTQIPPAEPFDVIWADPPYAMPAEEFDSVLQQLAAAWLVSDGLVVAERSTRDREPIWPSFLAECWSRRYGETILYYARPCSPEVAQGSTDTEIAT